MGVLKLLSLVSISSFVLGADIDTVRDRILTSLLPTSSTINAVVNYAKEYSKSLLPNCSWSDINYNAYNKPAAWPTIAHLERVQTMVQALTYPESPIFQNETIFNSMKCAFDFWLTNDFQNVNWFNNQIGTPNLVTAIAAMLFLNRTTASEQSKILEISYRACYWNTAQEGGKATGANLVSMIQIELQRGVFSMNETAVTEGFFNVWAGIEIVQPDNDGIQVDYSFHQHGDQLLIGSYGPVYLNGILGFLVLANNTKYQVPIEKLELLSNLLVFGMSRMSINRYWDWSVTGRSIARTAGMVVEMSTDTIRAIAPSVSLSNELLLFADRIDGKLGVEQPVEFLYSWVSDYGILRGASFAISLRLHSVRTVPGECDNGEDTKAEFATFGVLNLFNANTSNPLFGTENEYEKTYPAWDWQNINGVTAEYGAVLVECNISTGYGYRVNSTAFVGGVSTGRAGVVFMDYSTHALSAHKSWGFFPDGVLHLISNLTDLSGYPVLTTIIGRRIFSPSIQVGFVNGSIVEYSDCDVFLSDVSFLYVDQTFYSVYFSSSPTPQSIHLMIGNRTGSWSSIGVDGGSETVRMIYATIEHGKNLVDATSYYAVLPNLPLQLALEQSWNDLDKVLSSHVNTPLIQGFVKDSNIYIALWEANVVASFSNPVLGWNISLSIDTPCAAVVEVTSGSSLSITLSNPLNTVNQVLVTVFDFVGQGDSCFSDPNNSNNTIFKFLLPVEPAYQGMSVLVRCNSV
jgi:chondroitin AC lyase